MLIAGVIILVLAIFFLIVAIIDRKFLEVTHTEIDMQLGRTIRLAIISDLHNYKYGKANDRIKNILQNEDVEYICITGDLIAKKNKENQNSLALCKALSGLNKNVLFSLGNHELGLKESNNKAFKHLIKELVDLNVFILDDESYEDENIRFIGYTNKAHQYTKFKKLYKLTEAELTEELGPNEDNYFNIMLAHNPVYFKEYANWGARLVLSGHLHGGIIRLPFIGGIMSPQTFFSTKYNSGLYSYKNAKMYVSRGLGLHTIPVRIFNRPELSIITIR